MIVLDGRIEQQPVKLIAQLTQRVAINAALNAIPGGEVSTYVLVTEDGREIPAVLLEEKTVFTATAEDVRKGKVAASDEGVIVGTLTGGFGDVIKATDDNGGNVVVRGIIATDNGNGNVTCRLPLDNYNNGNLTIFPALYNDTI